MKDQCIVLVNKKGDAVGVAQKLAAHHANTPLHLAFSVYIFNEDGQFLITKRARSKKVWGGVWTNSCCGHPLPDESFEAAIKRRVLFELGMKVGEITMIVPNYIYKTPPFRGVIEHEFCPIFIAKAASTLNPNPDEVAQYKWIDWQEYIIRASQDDSNKWSWWCKDQMKHIQDNPRLRQYAK